MSAQANVPVELPIFIRVGTSAERQVGSVRASLTLTLADPAEPVSKIPIGFACDPAAPEH